MEGKGHFQIKRDDIYYRPLKTYRKHEWAARNLWPKSEGQQRALPFFAGGRRTLLLHS